MKCPKCGYVGFETTEKCRNCGYHFALAADDATGVADAALRTPSDDAVGPPLDFDFRTDVTPSPLGRSNPGAHDEFELPAPTPRTIESRPVDTDLPLFGDRSEAATVSAAASPVSTAAQPAQPGQRASRAAARPAATRLPTPLPISLSAPEPAVPQRNASGARAGSGRASGKMPRLALEPDSLPEAGSLLRARDLSASRTAGPLARAVAGVVDVVILGGLDLAVLYFTLHACRLSFSRADIVLLPIGPLVGFYALLNGVYLVAFTANGGQTIGKMATSIRVVGEDGAEVGAGQSMVRAFGYIASALPAGLGFVPGLFGPVRRALHDRLANTRVIKT